MTWLYSIAIHLFYLSMVTASLFNKKAKLWITGRNGWRKKLKKWEPSTSPVLWFHVASLGEFEQGRPLIEEFKKHLPDCRVILTFYSPSGFEIRKNYDGADLVCYLPLDTRYNARRFIQMTRPRVAFFIKYEFWNFYLKQLRLSDIPVYLISGIFRDSQVFFRWYGSWFRKKLSCFTHFFLQDGPSSSLLQSIGLNNVTVTGDTRFDRVSAIAFNAGTNSIAEKFSTGCLCIVAGSTWPADEEILIRYINESLLPVKYIIAPHEIDKKHINRLTSMIEKKYILYSESGPDNVADKQVLIIDNIGLLSSLYRYAQVAYVGGGFGNGIHNILEAAVFGIPVIFGPNYHKFREARQMIESGGAFSVSSGKLLGEMFSNLVNNTAKRQQASLAASNYIGNNTGATNRIVNHVVKTLT